MQRVAVLRRRSNLGIEFDVLDFLDLIEKSRKLWLIYFSISLALCHDVLTVIPDDTDQLVTAS
jgi:hypothetical protein